MDAADDDELQFQFMPYRMTEEDRKILDLRRRLLEHVRHGLMGMHYTIRQSPNSNARKKP